MQSRRSRGERADVNRSDSQEHALLHKVGICRNIVVMRALFARRDLEYWSTRW